MPAFDELKKIADTLADLIKQAIAVIKTFVESWKKPILKPDTTEGE